MRDPWSVEWEDRYHAPYMYRGNRWFSYDNNQSLAIKTEYSYDQGMAGVMIWSLETDDFLGICNNNNTRYPLLRTINHALFRREKGMQGVYTTTTTTTTPGTPCSGLSTMHSSGG